MQIKKNSYKDWWLLCDFDVNKLRTMHHTLPVRIYYEDTDAGGVVYHANYLKFAERGRTEFLRTLGHENSVLAQELGVMFVVRRVEADYLKTAHLDDLCSLKTSISSLKNTSFVMHQCLMRDGDIICDMHVVIVCVDAKTLRPARLPEKVKNEFQQFLET